MDHHVSNGGGSSWAGDLVQEKRRNKVLRESLHQVQGVEAPKRAKDLVQRKRKNKVLRESLHQAQGVGAPKRAKNLVQRKRRNKVLRGVKHHVSAGVGPSGPGDVVLPDEETRVCGGWSTTSGTPPTLWARETWCLWTKEQGFAGSEAPRPVRRRRFGPERRGACGRKNKGLRGVRHHVRSGGAPLRRNPMSEILYVVIPPARNPSFSQ